MSATQPPTHPPCPPPPHTHTQDQLYQMAKARAKALLTSIGLPLPRHHRSQLLNVLGVPKLPYVSHVSLSCQPATVRLPFSVVPFWQAVQVGAAAGQGRCTAQMCTVCCLACASDVHCVLPGMCRAGLGQRLPQCAQLGRNMHLKGASRASHQAQQWLHLS